MTDPRQLEFVQPSQEEKSAMSKRNCLQEDSFFDLKGDFSSAHCYRDDDDISSRQRHLLRASAASNDTQVRLRMCTITVTDNSFHPTGRRYFQAHKPCHSVMKSNGEQSKCQVCIEKLIHIVS